MSDLTALALDAAHQVSVAELHGAVCGIAACGCEIFPMQELVDLMGVDLLTDEDAVARFVHATIEALFSEDMSFTPLLPEDDAPMVARLEALALWCAGFLAGLGAGVAARGMDDLDDLPEDGKEIIEDFAAISDMDVDSGSTTDQSETALIELQEFVKVGALLVTSLLAYGSDDQAG